MTKTNKILTLFFFTMIICLTTYFICYFIAEKYFFDKFFYQKSISHGYVLSEENFNYATYGDRGKDLATLENPNQLKTEIFQDEFRIAIIGDSHVWGQGVKNNQRFAKLLHDKLNKIRSTRVFSYGKRGNNTLDYYNTYQNISNIVFANIYIIVPVTNDAILNKNNISHPFVTSCEKKFPKEKPLFFSENYPVNTIIDHSWINPINQCIVDSSLQSLPTSNAIYLIDKDYYRDNTQFNYYYQSLLKNNKTILSTSIGKFMDHYKKYFDDNVYKNFNLSPSDPHPNAIANQMYAEILFDEITTNPKWNFSNKPD
ncbi:MAG: SGNH/GDSL hydrolase family protein [Candidatus Shapirobacteria bacterium]